MVDVAAEALPVGLENRIVGSGMLKVDEALFNPANWRIHPLAQQEALELVLRQVGWVQQVVVSQRSGHLVDGHLRVQVADRLGETEVPCLYVDLSEEEELAILYSLDPLSAMAVPDKAKLSEGLAALRERSPELLDIVKALHVGWERGAPAPPEEFREYGSDIPTEHTCPRCGYQFSGGS